MGQGRWHDRPGCPSGFGRGGQGLREAVPGARTGRNHGLSPVAVLPAASRAQHLHACAASVLLRGTAPLDHDDQRPLLSTGR